MPGTIEIYADDVLKRLDWLMTTDPQARKQFASIIRVAVREAKKEVTTGAKTAVPNDPRQAYKAVRTTVYKKILGANVNILNSRKAAKFMRIWKPKGTLREGQWGGNRRTRSDRTKQTDGYFGADRAFILRFLNEGTTERSTRYGTRGRISGRRWFAHVATVGIEKTVEKMDELLQRAVVELWNK